MVSRRQRVRFRNSRCISVRDVPGRGFGTVRPGTAGTASRVTAVAVSGPNATATSPIRRAAMAAAEADAPDVIAAAAVAPGSFPARMSSSLLTGKVGLVVGVANKRSLSWGIAQAAAAEGASLVLTYQGERLEENVRELGATIHNPLILPCDVTDDAQTDAVFDEIAKTH